MEQTSFSFEAQEDKTSGEDDVVRSALAILARRVRTGTLLSSPNAVRDYLRLLLSEREHEVFMALFLDAQHRVVVGYFNAGEISCPLAITGPLRKPVLAEESP